MAAAKKQSPLAHDIYFLTSATDEGFSMYFYIRLRAGKDRRFFETMKGEDKLNLHDYGDVVESGIGEIPSAESIARMQRDYGFITPPAALA